MVERKFAAEPLGVIAVEDPYVDGNVEWPEGQVIECQKCWAERDLWIFAAKQGVLLVEKGVGLLGMIPGSPKLFPYRES